MTVARPPFQAGQDNRGVIKRSITIAGHRTSISLEDAFWSRLKLLAEARGASLSALVAEIDSARARANLSSAIRTFVVTALHAQDAPADPGQ